MSALPPLLLCSLLLTSSTNLYTDPDVGSCSAEKSGTEPGCGCGSLKRDSSQTSSYSEQDQYTDGKAARVWSLYMGGNKRTSEYGAYLTELLHKHNVETVLDAAAGTGVDSVMLLKAGFQVKSVDLSDQMLAEARKERLKLLEDPRFADWEIGRGDWLDLDNVEETVRHPTGGYDAVICIGNSFAHLPDPAGDQTLHKQAISNFHKVLRPGGILIVDHRNYDYILEHGTIPNTASRLYYQGGERIHKITTSLDCVEGVCGQVTLQYEIDITGHPGISADETRTKQDGTQIPVSKFSLSYYPHKLEDFVRLLSEFFGDEAEHTLLRDFRDDVEKDYVPSYYIHVMKKKGQNTESVESGSKSQSHSEMQLIPGGVFTMGTDSPILYLDAESPARRVNLPAYYIDKYEVTNAHFAEFIKQTNHVTDAQRFGDSFVLDGLLSPEENAKVVNAVQAAPWWLPVQGATWDHPEGIDTDIKDRMHHPVVHVSWNDAKAYCTWAGKRLPTEAEFEKACQGGKEGSLYPWGDEELVGGVHQANIWQGEFPKENTLEDGYKTTSPVGSYPANNFQIHDLIGNVWEWVDDWWTTQHSPDGTGPSTGQEKVKKGGSFMCTKQYCYRYRCPARTKTSADTTGLNVGFRCAKSADV